LTERFWDIPIIFISSNGEVLELGVFELDLYVLDRLFGENPADVVNDHAIELISIGRDAQHVLCHRGFINIGQEAVRKSA
jgi:hypothetical protein